MVEMLERPRRTALVVAVGVALVAVLLSVFWPAGVLAGAVIGVLLVVGVGRSMQQESATVVHTGTDSLTVVPADEDVRSDLLRLKAELGDEFPDFARAAQLVVATQYASAARLQRALDLPYVRARHLLGSLEEQRFVGPANGSKPRDVLLSRDLLPELERLFSQTMEPAKA